jgi:serine/threonine protein kinase
VHGDVKLENILMDSKCNQARPRLSDFELSSDESGRVLATTAATTSIGFTEKYVAPEVRFGSRVEEGVDGQHNGQGERSGVPEKPTSASDMYSLGVCMLLAFTAADGSQYSRDAITGEVHSLAEEVDVNLQRLVMDLTRDEPWERPSALEVRMHPFFNEEMRLDRAKIEADQEEVHRQEKDLQQAEQQQARRWEAERRKVRHEETTIRRQLQREQEDAIAVVHGKWQQQQQHAAVAASAAAAPAAPAAPPAPPAPATRISWPSLVLPSPALEIDVLRERKQVESKNKRIKQQEQELKREEVRLKTVESGVLKEKGEVKERKEKIARERSALQKDKQGVERERNALHEREKKVKSEKHEVERLRKKRLLPPRYWTHDAHRKAGASFAMVPLSARSDAGVWSALSACMRTANPDWLGVGRDVRESGNYKKLVLTKAWRIQNTPLWER